MFVDMHLAGQNSYTKCLTETWLQKGENNKTFP